MKALLAALMVLSLALVGCESMSDAATAVREKFAAREAPKVKTYTAEPRVTYEAVRAAAAHMGYRYVRGGPAQGEFEGLTGVASGEQTGSSRQLAMKVRLEKTLEGGTEVRVRITEIIEADSSNRAGQATESPLRDTPQYEVFFRRVQEALEGAGAAKK
jgi:outer membrane lipoprotein SlyB